MSESCIQTNNLIPWSLIIIGIISQSFITFLLNSTSKVGDGKIHIAMETRRKHIAMAKASYDSYQSTIMQLNEDEMTKQINPSLLQIIETHWNNIIKNKWFKRVQIIIIIYQCICCIIMLSLDTRIFIKSVPNTSVWNNYLCLNIVALNSSNFKRAMTFMMLYAMKKLYQNDASYFVKLIYFATFIMYGLISCLTWFIGIILYAFAVAILGCIVWISNKIRDKWPSHVWAKFAANLLLYLCFAMLIFFGIWFGSAIIRVYNGADYVESMRKTFNERSLENYWQNSKGNIDDWVGFVTWVL
eukprot:34809_1